MRLLALPRRLLPLLAVAPLSTALAQAPLTVFPHADDAPYAVSGQLNVITQYHPAFPAAYSGENSLRPEPEAATSLIATLYTAMTLARWTEVDLDVEMAAGGGISTALGLAGFTNLDVVRNPNLGSEPYLARAMVRQIVPLSDVLVDAPRTALALATKVPARRLEFRLGKLSTADFFDVNAVGSDSHLQFMNWTVDNNGAYDYAADTRGYTWGFIAEYHDRDWTLRLGEMLMPTVANGIQLDWDLSRARGENLELEVHHHLLPQREGAVRLLTFVNHANMGSYREAIDAFRAGLDPVPDVVAHRQQGRVKYGFGLNLEQEVGGPARAFLRAGWNEGNYESFAYTEVDDTIAAGVDVRGEPWGRPDDKVAAAFVSNGISADHREYLALGGRGFLLGDGALTYGRETIIEAYYTAHLWRGLFAALDVQYIQNPGYNRDRGPVLVGSVRVHADL